MIRAKIPYDYIAQGSTPEEKRNRRASLYSELRKDLEWVQKSEREKLVDYLKYWYYKWQLRKVLRLKL